LRFVLPFKTFIVKKIALLFVLAGFYACNPKPATDKTVVKKDSTATLSADKPEIVYVNSDTLLTQYELAKQIKKEFEGKRATIEGDLTAKGRALESEIADYQRKGREMTQEQAQQTEQRLGKKQQELIQYRDELSRRLGEQEAKRNEELYNRVTEFLKRYSKERNYKFVLTYQKGNDRVLFADEKLDITQDVVSQLNSEFKAADSTKVKK
jgi:outer membrane protein